MNKKLGFTIVELLIVIVIIGILVVITIVSYASVTARSNTTSAQSAAQGVASKAESFLAENGRYPYTTSELTSDPSKPYYLNPANLSFDLGSTQPATPSVLKFLKCGISPNAHQSDIVLANNNIRAVRIYYWSYSANNALSYVVAGNDTAAGVTCPTT